ncbi:hypothetical protein [Histidinibacterium aquaticum]|uniref:Uncharacterized protein n=1 Tax=Histidinibacterium aquaticum TaxID=2613962 RepID=A0A5J5GQ26_9RHOB|nr:hypothetical protein [Histidinibacterium aquaticum]KAA9010486.1 hypothetical protein F3S47_04380 [Histidinibacterium aquaticum]
MTDGTLDHFRLEDTRVTRRYFAKFRAITGHMGRVAGAMEAEGRLARPETEVLARYLVALSFTFRALSHKYLFSGRWAHAGRLTLDRVESGFPVFHELLTMASDASQAERHLSGLPDAGRLKDEMVQTIVGELEIPTKLQFALSQRLYYEELRRGGLFWARNDPQAVWLGTEGARRRFLLHWAVYDSQVNLPQVYLMEVEETGRTGLPRDERRWPELQSHLMAQALGGLKLLTIARGVDEDFDDIHPKRLRRFHLGPMYSAAFTRQSGPVAQVLEAARAPEGDDWALAWTEEDLRSASVEQVPSGWFDRVERQVFALDPFSARGAETGATETQRAIILPQRPYQALAELDPPGFREVRKFVVGAGGRVLSYR